MPFAPPRAIGSEGRIPRPSPLIPYERRSSSAFTSRIAARSSSTSAALSELTHAYSRLLRRGQPLRELGLSSGERSSHRSWASGKNLSSCGRMLAGAERGCVGCPPTNEGPSEVAISAARLLRRGQPLRELGLSSGELASHRSCSFR